MSVSCDIDASDMKSRLVLLYKRVASIQRYPVIIIERSPKLASTQKLRKGVSGAGILDESPALLIRHTRNGKKGSQVIPYSSSSSSFLIFFFLIMDMTATMATIAAMTPMPIASVVISYPSSTTSSLTYVICCQRGFDPQK